MRHVLSRGPASVILIPASDALPAPPLQPQETAPHLLKEMYTPCSRLTPYLEVLPKHGEVLTGYNWPEEYMPYLASDALVGGCPSVC